MYGFRICQGCKSMPFFNYKNAPSPKFDGIFNGNNIFYDFMKFLSFSVCLS